MFVKNPPPGLITVIVAPCYTAAFCWQAYRIIMLLQRVPRLMGTNDPLGPYR